MTTIYGIKNCDTMKKAMKWLDDNGVSYEFHDFKKLGLENKKLDEWLKKSDWETLLNRRGMMWRKLTDDVKEGMNAANAKKVMLEIPTIIKRPVLETNNTVNVGFSADDYAKLFKK